MSQPSNLRDESNRKSNSHENKVAKDRSEMRSAIGQVKCNGTTIGGHRSTTREAMRTDINPTTPVVYQAMSPSNSRCVIRVDNGRESVSRWGDQCGRRVTIHRGQCQRSERLLRPRRRISSTKAHPFKPPNVRRARKMQTEVALAKVK